MQDRAGAHPELVPLQNKNNKKCVTPSKHETLTQCWLNVGLDIDPPKTNIGPVCVGWESPTNHLHSPDIKKMSQLYILIMFQD